MPKQWSYINPAKLVGPWRYDFYTYCKTFSIGLWSCVICHWPCILFSYNYCLDKTSIWSNNLHFNKASTSCSSSLFQLQFRLIASSSWYTKSIRCHTYHFALIINTYLVQFHPSGLILYLNYRSNYFFHCSLGTCPNYTIQELLLYYRQ